MPIFWGKSGKSGKGQDFFVLSKNQDFGFLQSNFRK